MNVAQRKLVTKVAGIALLLVLIAVSSLLLNEWLPDAWLAAHGETIKWTAFVLFLGLGLLASKSGPMPTYTERHAAINDFYDEHPWAKVYLACCVMAIAVGLYFVATRHIDMGEVLQKLGILGFLGAVFLLILPNILVKLKEAYDAAGEEG